MVKGGTIQTESMSFSESTFIVQIETAIYTSDTKYANGNQGTMHIFFVNPTTYTSNSAMTKSDILNLLTIVSNSFSNNNVADGIWLTNQHLLINFISNNNDPVDGDMVTVNLSGQMAPIYFPLSMVFSISSKDNSLIITPSISCTDLGFDLSSNSPFPHVKDIFKAEIIIDCSTLFDSSMIPSLGTGAICAYLDYSSIKIYLGSGHNLFQYYYSNTFASTSSTYSFAPIVFSKSTPFYSLQYGCSSVSQPLFGAQVIGINSGEGSHNPKAIIAGPQHQFHLCDTNAKMNVFDGCLSLAGIPSEVVEYTFVVTNTSSGNIMYVKNPSSECLLDPLELYLAAGSGTKAVPSGIDISLTIRNIMNATDTTSIHVDNVAWTCVPNQPLFYIDQGRHVTIRSDQSMTLRAIVAWAYPDPTVKLSGVWTCAQIPTLISPQSYLTIPPQTLPYVPIPDYFHFKYEMFTNSTANGMVSVGSEDVYVTVTPTPAKVLITGGNRLVEQGKSVTLDSSLSINYESPSSGLSNYQWSCYVSAIDYKSYTPCDTNSVFLTLLNSNKTVVFSNLPAGTIIITLTVNSGQASDSTMLLISAGGKHVINVVPQYNPKTFFLASGPQLAKDSVINANSIITMVAVMDSNLARQNFYGLLATWTIYGPSNQVLQTSTNPFQEKIIQYKPTLGGWYTFKFTIIGVNQSYGFESVYVNHPTLKGLDGNLWVDNIKWSTHDILTHARLRVKTANAANGRNRYTFYINDIAVSMPGLSVPFFNLGAIYFPLNTIPITTFGVRICDAYAMGCAYQTLNFVGSNVQAARPTIYPNQTWTEASRYVALQTEWGIHMYTKNWQYIIFVAWNFAQSTQTTLHDLTATYYVSLLTDSGLLKALSVPEFNSLIAHVGYVVKSMASRFATFVSTQSPFTYNTVTVWTDVQGLSIVIGYLAKNVSISFDSLETYDVTSSLGSQGANGYISWVDGLLQIGKQLRVLNAAAIGDDGAIAATLLFFTSVEDMMKGASILYMSGLPCSHIGTTNQNFLINPSGAVNIMEVAGEFVHVQKIPQTTPYSFSHGGYSINFPNGLAGIGVFPIFSMCYGVHKIIWTDDLFSMGGDKVATRLLTTSINDVTGTELKVENTSLNIQINSKSYRAFQVISSPVCAYFNRTSSHWSNNLYCGATNQSTFPLNSKLHFNYSNNIITCQTCHLSSYAVVDSALTTIVTNTKIVKACQFQVVNSFGTFNFCATLTGSGFDNNGDDTLARGFCASYAGVELYEPCQVDCVGVCKVNTGAPTEVLVYFIADQVDCTSSTCPIGCSGTLSGTWDASTCAASNPSNKPSTEKSNTNAEKDKVGNILIGVGVAVLALILLCIAGYIMFPPNRRDQNSVKLQEF